MALTTVVSRTLTPAEVTQAQQRAISIANAGLSSATVPPGGLTYFIGFDGTNNNRANPSSSGDSQMTNVGYISGEFEDAASTRSNLTAKYYPGIGTSGNWLGDKWAAGPAPTATAKEIAEKAYSDFAKSASEWSKANPGQGISVMLATDSRGDGVGAIFSQLLYERGLTDPRTGAVLIPPGDVRIAGLMSFDSVTTQISGNVSYAPIVDNAVNIVANDETRSYFRSTDRSGEANFSVIGMPGNHGDVIGFYDNALGALTLGGVSGSSGAIGYFMNRGGADQPCWLGPTV